MFHHEDRPIIHDKSKSNCLSVHADWETSQFLRVWAQFLQTYTTRANVHRFASDFCSFADQFVRASLVGEENPIEGQKRLLLEILHSFSWRSVGYPPDRLNVTRRQI